ncbi:OmpA family protein [Pontibacter sp. HSC-36F09]|uniref:OmpA family protein n=1 Tax=Pontibacter sp. HSC-36F09 TaxID=2910966 RepID=UPI0020A1001D|nr:OmpA family protein [Pontibacter sp. HSC-36F09]MCP2043179.1 outer membrane protein OmpA-like peptidoglycan-associated protein [Pontibacter sp. HSC-36F09]
MKKTFIALLSMPLLLACNNENGETNQASQQETVLALEENVAAENPAVANQPAENPAFDISAIPVSSEDIGDFPFFTAPQGAEYINNAKVIDFDFIVFVTPESVYEVEGKTLRAHVHPDRKSETRVSGRFLEKSFEDAIIKAGGVKVFEGKLEGERKDTYKNLCTYAGDNGSIDIWNNPIVTYVIRRNDGNVYIAMGKGMPSSTSIQIVQEKPFEQTITKITSEKIKQDLLENGKIVLHINFDTDKATLKPDGMEVVSEIVKVLKEDPALRIAINGYTDNSGNKEHNQNLSESRASAVKAEVSGAGIAPDRLTSKGFGQENPIADNSTEEGKAQNRRVELVKI